MLLKTHVFGWHGPHFVVVWGHEEIRNTLTVVSQNPLVKVLWLCVGNTSLKRGVDQALHTLDLVILRQHRDVVLKWVWNPEALALDVRHPLVSVPVGLVGQCLVDAVVEVLVV